jgi:hypothetical protein
MSRTAVPGVYAQADTDVRFAAAGSTSEGEQGFTLGGRMLAPWRLGATCGIALLLLTGPLAAEPSPSGESPAAAEHLAALIAQLGSPRFEDREAATRALETLGLAAREPLRQALQSRDAEVRRRARHLVQKIERHVAAARILGPTHVRLVYQDMPLGPALADLARKTGLTIQLEGNRAKLAGRRITLDTGNTTLWEALDAFCQEAELTEPFPSPSAVEDRTRDDGGDRRVLALEELPGERAARADSLLVLRDGTPQPLPVYQAGALRVRTLPYDSRLTGQARAGGEMRFAVEVRLEPQLRLQSVLALRIDKAVDDQGQPLRLAPSGGADVGAFPGGWGAETLLLWDGVADLPTDFPSSAGQMPVRIRLPDRPSGILQELHGTVALQVQTALEPLVTVDRFLQAAGQTVQGADGSALKLIEVRRAPDGRVGLRLEATPPSGDLFLGGVPARILLVSGGWWRGRGLPMPLPIGAEQLALLDGQGRKFRRLGSTGPAVTGNGKAWEFTLVYQPGPGQGEPTRLVYSGRRTVTLEVPFTLKDVPLP